MGTLTTTVRLSKPTIGGDTAPTWPNELNSDMDYIDQAINQIISISIPDTNLTLVADGSSGDQARYFNYTFTGALTASRTITLPSNAKAGFVVNQTTGGQSIVLKCGAGTTIAVGPDKAWNFFYADGTNVTSPSVFFSSSNLITTGVLTVAGTTTLNGPTTIASVGGLTVSAGNCTVQGYVTINGSNTAANQNGWFLAPNGVGPQGPVSQPYGISSVSPMLSSGFFANSDVRVKSDVRRISPEEGVAFVELSNPVRYQKQGREEAGLIAQDQVRAGYGELVMVAPNEALPERIDDDGLISHAGVELSLNYDNYVAYLIAALQGALARIEALEKATLA